MIAAHVCHDAQGTTHMEKSDYPVSNKALNSRKISQRFASLTV